MPYENGSWGIQLLNLSFSCFRENAEDACGFLTFDMNGLWMTDIETLPPLSICPSKSVDKEPEPDFDGI